MALQYTKTSEVSLPQAMKSLSTDIPTKFREFLWPVKVRTWLPSPTSHSRSVESIDAEMTSLSLRKLTYDTALQWPWKVVRGSAALRRSYSRTMWSAEPTATVLLEDGLKQTLLTLTRTSICMMAPDSCVDHSFTLPSSEPE
eukprot:CAMPEP_0177593380 /NCGR_PEP_ID=MMETSP0419_2-20121207/9113_1 /TAXON_ID=582737 /ORGANISM="Tetraselmis sp., Strain GSL018" /LENGTH=141 /DNA_ID=CAMNT_0019084411 /DNA_START=275 /DNA_END=697 /DNA_ORIENTATION=+